MKLLLLLIIPNFLLFGCADSPDPHKPWYPHKPTAWRVTPQGHIRDAGPFASVEQGFTTEDEIDAAVDSAFARLALHFPEFGFVPQVPIALNDDYVLWAKSGGGGQWASGMQFGGYICVALYTRGTSPADPGAQFIKRSPGEYWGVRYDVWRFTTTPLVPALEHELLHTIIGDPGHSSPLWARVTVQ